MHSMSANKVGPLLLNSVSSVSIIAVNKVLMGDMGFPWGASSLLVKRLRTLELIGFRYLSCHTMRAAFRSDFSR
jgi:hypothetical protein